MNTYKVTIEGKAYKIIAKRFYIEQGALIFEDSKDIVAAFNKWDRVEKLKD